ncbi:acyltransferase family protein, partial [Saccharopolyspora taberi]|uniref:acyltransferase family protein n=1 Tax=Saccharopolyspora taberi TaxID=60895 RepID=UPI0031D907DD
MGEARVVHARPELFAPPNHGFAWLRMIGALVVIYGHSSPLVGTGELFPPEWPIQPDEGVLMGFFALSGFQITESWIRDPHPARFAAKRVLRLWPPMLTVSLGMALIIGPMVTKLPVGEYFGANGTWGYVVNNAGLLTLKHELPGVFLDNPWPDAVNGSLWTLPMELLAYGGLYVLLLLGAGRDRFRWLAVVALVLLIAWDRHLENLPGAESAGSLLSVPIESLVAFLVAFAAGVVLNLYRIPLSPTAAIAGLAVLALMPNNQVGSFWMCFAVSYAVIVTGHFWPSRLEVPGVWVNGSYGVYVWGFPIQQLLAMAGIANQYLMLLCAAPLAYVMGTLSWRYVEEPTMRLRHYITPPERKPAKSREEPEADADGGDPGDLADLDGPADPGDLGDLGEEPEPTRRAAVPSPPRGPRPAAPPLDRVSALDPASRRSAQRDPADAALDSAPPDPASRRPAAPDPLDAPTRRPAAMDPSPVDPPTRRPSASGPAALDSASRRPAAPDPSPLDPDSRRSAALDPAALDPALLDSASRRPVAPDPAPLDPPTRRAAAMDPASPPDSGRSAVPDPAPVDPPTRHPAALDSVSRRPAAPDPAAPDSASRRPAAPDPAPLDPASRRSAAPDPAP